MKRFAFLAAAGLGLTLTLTARDARALGPVDLEAGLKVGVGTKPSDSTSNPFGFGLGARAGVGLFNVYLGASAIHYLGSSTDVLGATLSTSTTLVGGELGYTITQLPIIRIRPQIGLGTAIGHSSVENAPAGFSTSTESDSHLYLEPGVTVLVPLGLIYFGADANALILPGVDTATATGGTESKTFTAFTIHGQLGVRL